MSFLPHELVQDDGDDLRVHTRAYHDADIFAMEMRKIFESNWVFVAHESELPEPGDYVTTVVGSQPVIVSRSESGDVNVLLNRCRHRGSVVCRLGSGHANHFRCPYHNWIYRNDGELLGYAQRSGYPGKPEDADLDLVRAYAVGRYRGLVFASLTKPAVSLDERLEHVTPYIDLWVERDPRGDIRTTEHAHQFDYPGNWKFQMENGNDGYHGNYVHESFLKVVDRAGESTVKDFKQTRQVGSVVGLPHGDGFIDRPEGGMAGQFDYHAPRHAEYHKLLTSSYGASRAREILGQRNLLIFPNLYLFESHLRIIRPVAVDRTAVVMRPTLLAGASDEFNAERIRTHDRFFGPAGFGAPDDIEMFVNSETGMRADLVEWVTFRRGLHREVTEGDVHVGGHSTDESPQRAAYRAWRGLMERDNHDG